MFNKKFLKVLIYILIVMVLAQLVLQLFLGIWMMATLHQPEMFENVYLARTIGMLSNIGVTIFIYVFIAALRSIVMGPGAPPPRPPMPFVRRPAPMHQRK